MFPKINQRFELGFITTIPTTIKQLREAESWLNCLKQNLRSYRRYLTLSLYRQNSLERATIPPTAQRVLWLNPSSTSIGDSLMELSGRSLLRGKFARLDLLTDRKNSQLYQEDDIFSQIFTDPAVMPAAYDLILLDIYNSKSLKIKYKYFAKTPFCAIQAYFYGADFNRMLFSYHRINALLGYPLQQTALDQQATHYLQLKYVPEVSARFKIVVAVGGEDPSRSYLSWGRVIAAALALFPAAKIVLIGSANASASAAIIDAQFSSALENQVAKLSLLATARQIAGANLFLGADGGLMHIAEAYKLDGVALFAKFRPELRLGYTSRLRVLYTDSDVNQIAPQQIIEVLHQLAKSFEG